MRNELVYNQYRICKNEGVFVARPADPEEESGIDPATGEIRPSIFEMVASTVGVLVVAIDELSTCCRDLSRPIPAWFSAWMEGGANGRVNINMMADLRSQHDLFRQKVFTLCEQKGITLRWGYDVTPEAIENDSSEWFQFSIGNGPFQPLDVTKYGDPFVFNTAWEAMYFALIQLAATYV